MNPGQSMGTALDYGIIIGYFVVILGFGTLFGRGTKTTRDFFFGGQRFSWWIIAFSLVATTVGSYSFVKYSAVAYDYGLSSTQSYLNDWFWMPLFLFGWLPIIYYGRVTSVPEYFERRFGRRTRLLATVVVLLHLMGYIGINLYTLGVALHAMLGWPVFLSAVIIAVICALYVTVGGQTSVIMTDLIQGLLLLGAGFLLFGLGWQALGGPGEFWAGIPYRGRLPLAYPNNPPDFHFLGILWQDGIVQTAFGLFLSQGMIMRFLSAKSVRDGRRAQIFLLLVLFPLAAVAVAGAGWLARSMTTAGVLPEGADSRTMFVLVSHVLCTPGVFGFVMAALTAALMSTADSLINAVSAVFVNDVWRVYVRPAAHDRHYLKVARWVSLAAAGVGLAMVPVYASFGSIYTAHGAFTAAVGPAMVVAVLLGAFWARYTPAAAFWTILGGMLAVGASVIWPDVLEPFAFGAARTGEHFTTWPYARALFGLLASLVLALAVTPFTRPRPREALVGMVWSSLREARRRFKGGEPNEVPGAVVRLLARELPAADCTETPEGRWRVQLPPRALDRLRAAPGDLLHLADRRWWFGGLRSVEAVAEAGAAEGEVQVPAAALRRGGLRAGELVRIEKTL